MLLNEQKAGSELDKSAGNTQKSLQKQEKELKRIMQSQKSMRNATQSMAKLMRIHEYTQTWSLIDVDQSAVSKGTQGSAATRVITNNPHMFKDQPNMVKKLRNGTARTQFNSKVDTYKDFTPDYGTTSKNIYPNFKKGIVGAQKTQQTQESSFLNQ